MTYQGIVSGGVIVLPPEVVLPEGASVTVDLQKNEKVDAVPKESRVEMRNGIPVFLDNGSGFKADLELVNRLRDEYP